MSAGVRSGFLPSSSSGHLAMIASFKRVYASMQSLALARLIFRVMNRESSRVQKKSRFADSLKSTICGFLWNDASTSLMPCMTASTSHIVGSLMFLHWHAIKKSSISSLCFLHLYSSVKNIVHSPCIINYTMLPGLLNCSCSIHGNRLPHDHLDA